MTKVLDRSISRLYDRAVANWYEWYRHSRKFIDRHSVNQQFEYWRSQEAAVLRVGENGYRLELKQLGLSPPSLARLEEQLHDSPEVVIADIDRNGFLQSYFGPIANTPAIDKDKYLPRRRFQVQVVARNGYAGVRKSYRGSKQHFVNELKILHTLVAAGCHVPAIMAVDFDNLTITFSYIAGHVLKQDLASRGAQLYSVKLGKAAGLGLSERRRVREKRAREGTRVLADVVGEQFLERLFQELCRIHDAGVLDLDIKYGNIINESKTKQPYWIDFEHATLYPKQSSRAFQILSNRDIIKFNQFFGTGKPVAPALCQAGVKVSI